MPVGLSFSSITGQPLGEKTIVAAGTTSPTATAVPNYSGIVVHVTGANNTKGVILPVADPGHWMVVENSDATHTLAVYPPAGKTIAGGAADAAFTLSAASSILCFSSVSGAWLTLGGASGGGGAISTLTDTHIFVGNNSNVPVDVAVSGDATMADTGALTVTGVGGSALTATAAELNYLHSKNPVVGVGASYKIARGVHQQAAASDTVATSLTTVVAVVAQWRDTPTAKQTYLTTSIGNQSGAPAAGSFLSLTFKSTYAASDDWSDNLSYNWIAVGT